MLALLESMSLLLGNKSELYLLVAIPIGYICYSLARMGIGDKDKAIHIIYISLLFSLISVFAWSLIPLLYEKYFISKITSAIMMPIGTSIFWRKWLRKWMYMLLNKFRIANATEYRSVLSEITNDTSLFLTQIVIYLKSGKVLICDYTYKFRGVPIGGYRTDEYGNIALYVTATKNSEKSKRKEIDDHTIENPDGSNQYRITHVNESDISRVEFVYINKASEKSDFFIQLLRHYFIPQGSSKYNNALFYQRMLFFSYRLLWGILIGYIFLVSYILLFNWLRTIITSYFFLGG